MTATDPERWRRTEELYHAARTRPADERDEFIVASCGDDSTLLADVRSLLAQPVSEGFPERPVLPTPAPGGASELIGHRLGGYQVETLIGVGGMGEVYRARDLRLGRDVALKFLPSQFLLDADRLARFNREARLLASLNHPNIAAIYGFEEADGVRALVLELVDGDTLAERIARGSLRPHDALAIAAQVAEALQAAHEKGIIHRDLKPPNISVTTSGAVKVLDFGLAKVMQVHGTDESVAAAHAVTATREGFILGTVAYMSPEQARGEAVDRRTDIWAFGCVLFEMLTGRAAFTRATIVETLAAIQECEPDFGSLPPETSADIRRLLRRTLQKDPQRRLRDIGDARLEIADVLSGPTTLAPAAPVATPRPVSVRWRERVAWALGTLLAIAGTVSVSRPVLIENYVNIWAPPTRSPASLAISPNGRMLVFEGTIDDVSRLWLRVVKPGSQSTAALDAEPLNDTEDGALPFWSSDSQRVNFFAQGRLKQLDLATRIVRDLAPASASPLGGTASRDGTILFAPNLRGGIVRISEQGGEPRPVRNDGGVPQFLPDGRRYLFLLTSNLATTGAYVGEPGIERPRLLETGTALVSAPPDHVLFVRDGTLFAQRLNPDSTLGAEKPTVVADRVLASSDLFIPAVSVSAEGSIVFRRGSTGDQRQLVWFDRTGNEIERIKDPGGSEPSSSPDGRFVAVNRAGNGFGGISVLETATGTFSWVNAFRSNNPLFSRSGDNLVFSLIDKTPSVDLFIKPLASEGTGKPLLITDTNKTANDWSPDGRYLLYRNNDPKTRFDIMALPFETSGTPGRPFPVVQTNSEEREAQFSPDGDWIAYQSNRSGVYEIYVQPFQDPARPPSVAQPPRPVLASRGGGTQVRWSHDGTELFYIAPDGMLMAVPLRTSGGGLIPDTPVRLFPSRVNPAAQTIGRQQYTVSNDGKRFLISIAAETTSAISLIQNWKPEP